MKFKRHKTIYLKICVLGLVALVLVLPSCGGGPSFEPDQLVHSQEPIRRIRRHPTRPGQVTAISTRLYEERYRKALFQGQGFRRQRPQPYPQNQMLTGQGLPSPRGQNQPSPRQQDLQYDQTGLNQGAYTGLGDRPSQGSEFDMLGGSLAQPIALSSSPFLEEDPSIRIEDVSIQEHRIEGNFLMATLKLFLEDVSAEIDLIGELSNGTADMIQASGYNHLVYGVALCIDQDLCRHIILDIYYRDSYGKLVRYQVESINSFGEDEIDEDDFIDEDNEMDAHPVVANPQTDSPQARAENPSPYTGQQRTQGKPVEGYQQEQINKRENPNRGVSPLPASPENHQDRAGNLSDQQPSDQIQPGDKLPENPVHIQEDEAFEEGDSVASAFSNRPPSDIDAINSLPIPTVGILQEQQRQTTRIRERVASGESWEDVIISPDNSPEATVESEPLNEAESGEDPLGFLPSTPFFKMLEEKVGHLAMIFSPTDPKGVLSDQADLEGSQEQPTDTHDEVPEEPALRPSVTTSEDFVRIDPDIEVELAMGVVSGQLVDIYQRGVDQNLFQESQAIDHRGVLVKDVNGAKSYIYGQLQFGEPLLNDSHYAVRWGDSDPFNVQRRWVTTLMNVFLKIVGSKFKQKYPEHFLTVNRSSNRDGGVLVGKTLTHKTHQNGLDVDMAYPHSNPQTRFWSVLYNRRFVMTEQDARMTLDLLKIMSDTGIVNKYHVDQRIKDYLIEMTRRDGTLEQYRPVLQQLCPLGGHDDHIHIQLICTQFNPRCRNSMAPAYSRSCQQAF